MHIKVAVRNIHVTRWNQGCYEGFQLVYCGCKMNWEAVLPYAISLQYQSNTLITTVSSVCLQPG